MILGAPVFTIFTVASCIVVLLLTRLFLSIDECPRIEPGTAETCDSLCNENADCVGEGQVCCPYDCGKTCKPRVPTGRYS